MAKNIIPIQDFNQGGLAHSKWSGAENTLYKFIGFDPHSQPGILNVEQKLTKDSEATVDEFCKEPANCSNGSLYWGSSTSGKIWELTSGGTWRLVHTVTPESGEAKILGIREYQNYLYVVTQSRVHRIEVSKAADNDWATDLTEDWKPLNLDQTELNSTGQLYTLTTAVNEGATHLLSFTPVYSPIEGIALNVDTVGSGDWTVKIHDSSNNEVATATIVNGSMATGWVIFELDSVFYPILGDVYHAHAYSSVADGKVISTTTVDFATANARVYRQTTALFHPMEEQNLVLYIGNGNLVAQINVETFTDAALDIKNPLIIKSLGKIATDLLIGTWVADTVTSTEIIRWNTWSVSFTNSDPIPEVGINAFLPTDNFVLVQAGKAGNIYYYNGETLEPYFKIPGTYSSTATGEVYPSSVASKEGQVLFGFSNGTGNPADQLVYRFARHSRDFDHIIDQPYPISERSAGEFVLSSIEIGGILAVGSLIYVAWKRGSSYGVDKLDASNKLDGAYYESRIMSEDREENSNFAKAVVPYASLPDNTDIDMYLDANYAGYGSALSKIDDDERNVFESNAEEQDFTTLQLKVKITASGNTAPQIESSGVFLK